MVVSSTSFTYTVLGLENKATMYEADVVGADESLHFNYCAYGTYGSNNVNVYAWAEGETANADDHKVATNAFDIGPAPIRDDSSNVIGITLVQTSDEQCTAETAPGAGDAVNYSMTTNLKCDATITSAPTIEKVTKAGCVYTVDMKHKDGCPTSSVIDIEQAQVWLQQNEWVIGIIYVIAGPIIALFGTAWFPYVVASLVAIFVMGTITMLSLAFGWMA